MFNLSKVSHAKTKLYTVQAKVANGCIEGFTAQYCVNQASLGIQGI